MDQDVLFGGYRIEEKLGEGGMGVVYRAWDSELERTVAIKTLLSSIGDDPEVTERFVREAKAASRLQHPSIVTIYHVGEHAGTRFIVMEFVEGKTLKKIIGGRPLDLNLLCNISIQVCDALALAHEKNVVHRDLKAENVMLTPRMQAKILDFGLAKLREAKDSGVEATVLTQVGIVMGTVSHMSPEQALGLEVDGRSDVFSFGVVLYEMATGRMPFEGPSAQAVMARVLNQEPVPAGQINPDLPPELQALIQDCLRKDRNLRSTAVEVLGRLKKIEASLSAHQLSSPGIRGDLAASTIPTPVVPSGPQAQPSAVPLPMPATPISAPAPAVARPVSGRAAVKSGRAEAALPPASPAQLRTARLVYQGVRVARIGLSLALLAVPLAFLSYFVISGNLIKPEVVEGTRFLRLITAIVSPTLNVVNGILNFQTQVQQWNFLALGLAIVSFIVRHMILVWVQRLENFAKNRMVQMEAATAASKGIVIHDKASSHRLGMLREYAEAKQSLLQEKRQLAFLSVDVVGSTKMKIGEDKLTIEHAFSEYKKFVDRILKEHNVWKVAWTPDGIMCAFPDLQSAVKAGQGVLGGLPWFNDGVHHLRTPFNVRCGVNAGEVVFPAEKAMEEISDEAIDIAGHLQKDAAPGALWLARVNAGQLPEQTGFVFIADRVDGLEVLEWRVGASDVGLQGVASAAGQ